MNELMNRSVNESATNGLRAAMYVTPWAWTLEKAKELLMLNFPLIIDKSSMRDPDTFFALSISG